MQYINRLDGLFFDFSIPRLFAATIYCMKFIKTAPFNSKLYIPYHLSMDWDFTCRLHADYNHGLNLAFCLK